MGFLLGLILLMGMGIYGQQRVLSGRVVDTSAGKSIQYAVVALLRQEDSTLVSYVRSAVDGSFGLKAPLQGIALSNSDHCQKKRRQECEALLHWGKALSVVILVSS